jgi:hypothetical protein
MILPALLLAAAPAPAVAADGDPVWLAEPIVLHGQVDAAEVGAVRDAIAEGLATSLKRKVLIGEGALLMRSAQSETSPDADSGIQAARSLLAQGEDLYMAFKFGSAAEILSKSADLFTDSLARLSTEDLPLLYRARLLAGLSWFEAGKTDVAKDSFVRLIVIRPDFEPDPTLVSPKAREVFRQALADVRNAGLGSVEVRTEPDGAEVFLDGVSRGRSPITITPLPGDKHYLRVTLPGYATHLEEFEGRPPERVLKEIKLKPTLTRTALGRLMQAARQGRPPEMAAADLDLIVRTARLDSVVLVGIGRQPEKADLLVTLLRFSATGRSHAATTTQPGNITGQLASQLTGGDPAAGLPSRVDFSAALLGLGPDWASEKTGEEDEGGGLLTRWWFWTGVAVLAGGLTAGTVWLASSGTDDPDRTRFFLEFP